MANKNNEQYPSYHLHITIKSISFAALIGISGYSLYPGSSHSEEVSRYDKRLIIALQNDVRELQLNMKIFTAQLAKQNRKVIEKNDRPDNSK